MLFRSVSQSRYKYMYTYTIIGRTHGIDGIICQQDFSIKEANLALNQAKLAAENDPTTLKNQKLLLDIEKTKQAIAQADIKNPLEIERLKKQIANIGTKSGSSSGGSSRGGSSGGGSSSGGSNNSDAVQHALNVIQGNQEKGIQYIVNTGKQYNFGSYITKMKVVS